MLNGYAFQKRLDEYKKQDQDKYKEEKFKTKHVGERDVLA
jgi:hypothetical protein